MYSVPELVRILGLSTENQVRNRIEAVRDLLAADIRRGANNQLLITERGLDTLKALQALCESGHTLREASDILRHNVEQKEKSFERDFYKAEQNQDGGWRELVVHLAEQVRALEGRVAALEARVAGAGQRVPWWTRWLGAQ
ncbi:hypothetical protein H5T52_09835 [Candidatus Bipolaricaulota bacterium]|nr:hypothetical protein [Candidatus Bipolaricaulota bacterium]